MGVKDSSLKIFRLGVLGILILGGGASLITGANFLVGRTFNFLRPQLEDQLSKTLAHSLTLGAYEGIRPWGISIGKTYLRQGQQDNSTVKASRLSVRIAPLASLLRLRPVVVLRPYGASVQLNSKNGGPYWGFGETEDAPPKVDLLIRIVEPASVTIDSAALSFSVVGNSSLSLSEKKINGVVKFALPDGGSFSLKGRGYWDRLELRARARLNSFKLEPFKQVLNEQFALSAAGRLDGDLQLSVNKGLLDCQGAMTLADFNFVNNVFTDSISTNQATVTCKDKLLSSPSSEWRYGPWAASISAKLPLKPDDALDLTLAGGLRLAKVANPGLNVTATLPLIFSSESFETGQLLADFKLDSYPLAPFSSILGIPLSGSLQSLGRISGPLSSLKTDFSLAVSNPQFGMIRLQEVWRGQFKGSTGGGGSLQMSSAGAAVPGTLLAKFNSDWTLDNLNLKRLGGNIAVEKEANRFIWSSQNFRLDRVEVALPPQKLFKRIFGQFSGKGNLVLSPFLVEADMTLLYPRFMGVRLQQANLRGEVVDNRFDLNGSFLPPDEGKVTFSAKGTFDGELSARADANDVTAGWIVSTALQLPRINLASPSASGKSSDLGGYFIKAMEDSLDGRMNAMAQSQLSLLKEQKLNPKKQLINPDDLQGQVDAVIELEGKEWSSLDLAVELTGDLWPRGKRNEFKVQKEPFLATISGPLQGGVGDFSLLNVPFSLLYLIGPLPSSLQGTFGLTGKYRLGKGESAINAELILNDAQLADESFVLEKGSLSFSESILKMDVVLRSSSSLQPLRMVGDIPITPDLPIDFRIESHGDGLRFLDGLTDGALVWEKGTADLRFLIRGTFNAPEANGFLVIRDASFLVVDKRVSDLNSSMVFDFDRLELQTLQGTVGEQGAVTGSGSIPLFTPLEEQKDLLLIEMKEVPWKFPNANVQLASNLKVKGALFRPLVGGNLSIKQGFISLQRPDRRVDSSIRRQPISSSQLFNSSSYPEQKWDMKNPLVLFVEDQEAPTSQLFRSAMNQPLSNIGFDDLRLTLGPNLRITSPPLANFNVEGLLSLNGGYDQALNARGVVRLTKGRVNLFTTTFGLDTNEPNVAVFTPSMGLVPYVDVTMKSRVPDTVRDSSNLSSSTDFASNGSGTFGIGGSRFVNVELSATGPADRLTDNFQLRSTPPMPQKQLLGLIGGNSLTRLLGGGEREVLANVLSRSLISPALGNLTGSFNEGLEVSIYPAYVSSPDISKEDSGSKSTNPEDTVGELPPQQAWVTELGIDLNKKFNFSVQATPNRKDIPPQGTLTFQVNSSVGILGALDKNGMWQSQVQLFLRF